MPPPGPFYDDRRVEILEGFLTGRLVPRKLYGLGAGEVAGCLRLIDDAESRALGSALIGFPGSVDSDEAIFAFHKINSPQRGNTRSLLLSEFSVRAPTVDGATRSEAPHRQFIVSQTIQEVVPES